MGKASFLIFCSFVGRLSLTGFCSVVLFCLEHIANFLFDVVFHYLTQIVYRLFFPPLMYFCVKLMLLVLCTYG